MGGGGCPDGPRAVSRGATSERTVTQTETHTVKKTRLLGSQTAQQPRNGSCKSFLWKRHFYELLPCKERGWMNVPISLKELTWCHPKTADQADCPNEQQVLS